VKIIFKNNAPSFLKNFQQDKLQDNSVHHNPFGLSFKKGNLTADIFQQIISKQQQQDEPAPSQLKKFANKLSSLNVDVSQGIKSAFVSFGSKLNAIPQAFVSGTSKFKESFDDYYSSVASMVNPNFYDNKPVADLGKRLQYKISKLETT
jgi:hypothetical protein